MHGEVVKEGSAKAHRAQDAQFLGCLEHGHKAATGPGDDPGIGPGVEDLFHVGGKVGGVEGRKDVVGDELATEEGAGIAEGLGAAIAEGVVRRDLDEGFVLVGQVLAEVDRVLVVLAAGAEGVVVEVDAGDVVGRCRGDDEHHVVLQGDLL